MIVRSRAGDRGPWPETFAVLAGGTDDRRTPRPRRFVDGDRVIGGVSGDAHERALDRSEQIEGGGRIITRRLGQRVDKDHAGLIDAKVELPPATSAAATVFRGGPLTCSDDGQPRAVEHEMDALAGRDRSQTALQMLTAPGERRIVGGGEIEAHHPEQGVQEPFGLAQREMVEESQGQGGLDGEIRVAPLPTPPAAPAGRPGSDRFRGQPHRHIAAANEGLIVGRPVRNAVLRLIRGMDLRLHPYSVAPAEGHEKCAPPAGSSCNNAVDWARGLGTVEAFGIEGTGSYGVGLASFVRRHAVRVVEVSHCDRRKRRNNGKSDTIDAEAAARSVLAGVSTAVPKSADGSAEMARQIKVARDTAVKARSAAIITLKTLIVNAPSALREDLTR